MATRTHTYHGVTVRPCISAVQGPATSHKGRWITQSYHQTGLPYADECCPHYVSLAQAKEAIDLACKQDEMDAWTR